MDIFKSDKKKKEESKPPEAPNLTPAPLPPSPSGEPQAPPGPGMSPPAPEPQVPQAPGAQPAAPTLPPELTPADASPTGDLPPLPTDNMAPPSQADGADLPPPPGGTNMDALSAALDSLDMPGQNLPPAPEAPPAGLPPMGAPPTMDAPADGVPELPPDLVASAPAPDAPPVDLPPMDAPPAMDAPAAPEQMPEQETIAEDLPPVPEIPKEWSNDTQLDPIVEGVPSQMPPSETQNEEQLDAPPTPLPPEEDEPSRLSIPSLEDFDDMPSIEKNDTLDKVNKELKTFDTPHFIKVEDFSLINDHINQLGNLIKDSERVFTRMKEVKTYKDKKLQEWHKTLEEVQRKIVYLDNKLFEVA